MASNVLTQKKPLSLARAAAFAGTGALLVAAVFLIVRNFSPVYLVAVGIGLVAMCEYLFFGKHFTIGEEAVSHKWIVIAVVFACAVGLFNIVWQNAKFPTSLIGIDTWTHMARTLDTPNWAYLGTSYSLMHAWLRGVIEVTGMSYKWASVLFWGGLQTLGIILLVTLIGWRLFSAKVGAAAALVVSCAGWVVQWGQWPIPNAMGAVYVLAAAYLWIRAYQTEKMRYGWWSLALIPVALTTHLFALAWVAGTIAVMSLPVVWQKGRRYMLAVGGIALVVFVGWYSATLYLLSGLSNLDPASGLTYALGQAPAYGQNYLSNFAELTWNSLGFFMFMGIGLIGILLMLRQGSVNRAWVALAIGTLAIGFVPSLFGFSVIEHRWWYLAQVLMAVPVGVAVMAIPGAQWVVAVTAFCSLVGLPSNISIDTFSHNQIVRYALTQDEIDAYAVAESYEPEIIGSDPLYTAMIRGVNHYRDYYGMVRMIDTEILTGDYSNCKADAIILRNSLTSEPWGYGSGAIYRISDNLTATASRFGYREVWENESATVMVK